MLFLFWLRLLCSQDLPEVFENDMAPWMEGFHTYLEAYANHEYQARRLRNQETRASHRQQAAGFERVCVTLCEMVEDAALDGPSGLLGRGESGGKGNREDQEKGGGDGATSHLGNGSRAEIGAGQPPARAEVVAGTGFSSAST